MTYLIALVGGILSGAAVIALLLKALKP